VKIDSAVRPGRWIEKKGKDRTVQKVTKWSISPIWGEAHWGASPQIGDTDWIELIQYRLKLKFASCVQSFKMIFSGVTILHGVEFSIFTDFCMGLTTVQRCCAACDFAQITTALHGWYLSFLKLSFKALFCSVVECRYNRYSVVRVIAEVHWHAKINKTRGLLLASTVLGSAPVLRASSHVSPRTSTGSTRPSAAIHNSEGLCMAVQRFSQSLYDFYMLIFLLSFMQFEQKCTILKTALRKL